VLAESAHEVDGSVREGRAWVPIAALPDLIGWTVRPEGLCCGDVCVPMAAERRAALVVDGQLDLGGTAQLLGRAKVIDAEDATRQVIALALDPESVGSPSTICTRRTSCCPIWRATSMCSRSGRARRSSW
jgi:hypothetical protein